MCLCRGRHLVQLQKQALLQIPRSSAWRIQLLYKMSQHIFHFLNIRLDILVVKKFIDNGLQIRMKIACIIQCSHQIGGDLRLLWGHVHRIQLQLPLLVH